MYEYINGIYRGVNKDYIVVENNGIGYKINTSGSTIAKTPKVGENIMLYLQQIQKVLHFWILHIGKSIVQKKVKMDQDLSALEKMERIFT